MERRTCLATQVNLVGNVLTVTGDAAANDVELTQNDTTNRITVNYDGETVQYASSAVRIIEINLKGGPDKLDVGMVQDTNFTRQKDITLKLGAGEDWVKVDYYDSLNGDDVIEEKLKIDLFGGPNRDHVNAVFGMTKDWVFFVADLGGGNDDCVTSMSGDCTSNALVYLEMQGGPGADSLQFISLGRDIAANVIFYVTMHGGAGEDYFNSYSSGEMDGDLTLRFDSQGGNDRIEFEIRFKAGSTGEYDAVINGGTGDDILNTQCYDESGFQLEFEQYVVDGGPGKDGGVMGISHT